MEHRWVKNWIQWIPQDNGLWRPFNVQQVESWHAECKALVVYNWGDWQFQGTSFFEWNHAQGFQLGEERKKFYLPYVPRWKISHQWDIVYNDWSGGWSQRWISERYTDQSNALSMQLPAVQLWNMYLSKSFHLRDQLFSVQMRCENIMNQQYQEVRSYAIPGRVWNIQINYQINP